MSHKTTRSQSRRWAVLAAVVLTTTGIVSTTAPPARAQEPKPDPDITHYVLFGFEKLHFKGGNAGHTSVIDGNIGVNKPGRDGNDFRMNICANGPMRMPNNTIVASDSLRMGDTSTATQECDVYRAFTNDAANNNEPARNGTFGFVPPVVTATPLLPDFTCDPNNPFTVPRNGTATMTPGVYGVVNWQNATTVTLTPGTYTMCRLTTGQNVRVVTQPGVVLQIAQDFDGNNGMRFDGSDCDDIPIVYVRSDGLNPNNDNSVSFGRNSELWGHFYAPHGQMNLGHSTDLHGTFWARSIGSDWNVDVEYCPPPLEPPDTGRIVVTKKITGAEAGLPPDAEFTIHFDCTIPTPGVRNAVDGHFKLEAGETKQFRGLPIGTTCSTREVHRTQPLPGFEYQPAEFIPDRTVTITTEDKVVGLVIENPVRAVFGTIRVHKEITGSTHGYVPGSRFRFFLDCAADRFDTAFTLAPGETFRSDPVRVGVPCTVRETGMPRARRGFAYQRPSLTPASGEVTVQHEDQTVTVHVSNRLTGSRPGTGTGPIGPSRSTSLTY